MSSDDHLVEIFAELEINGNTSFVEEVAWRVLGKNEWFSLPPYLLPTRPAETTLQPLSIKSTHNDDNPTLFGLRQGLRSMARFCSNVS